MNILRVGRFFIPIFLLLFIFSGCSDKSDDAVTQDGEEEVVQQPGEDPTYFSGKVVDGYLANAKVYYEGYESEAQITDDDGDFTLSPKQNIKIIMEPIYDEDNNSLTIDIATGLPFKQVLSSPAGYGVVTPITTILAETDISIETLAEELDLNTSLVEEMIKLDPLEVMNDTSDKYDDSKKTEANKILTQAVVLENQLDILLSDENFKNDTKVANKLENKKIVIKSIFETIKDDNDTKFSTLTTENLTNAYKSAVVTKNKNADISNAEASTKASIIASAAKSLNDGIKDINYSDTKSGINLAKQVAKSTDSEILEIVESLVETKSTDLSQVQNELDAVNYISEAAINQAKADTLIDIGADENTTQAALVQAQSAKKLAVASLESGTTGIKINPVPTMLLSAINVDLNSSVKSYDLNIALSDKNKDDVNTTSTTKYIARVGDSGIILLPKGKSILRDNNTTLRVTINGSGVAKLYLTPIDEKEKTGLEQIVKFNITKIADKTPLSLTDITDINLSDTTNDGRILSDDDQNTSIDLNITDDGDGALKELIVDSNDTDILKVKFDGNQTLKLIPVYNGSAKVTILAIDTNNLSTKEEFNVTVSDISLPPVLKFTNEPIAIPNTSDVDINISFSVYDFDVGDGKTDDANNTDVNITTSNGKITCNYSTKNGNLACTITSSLAIGKYSITATPQDKVATSLHGKAKTFEITVFQGNVAPKLNLAGSGTTQSIDALSVKDIPYSVTDLNSEDNITIFVSSSDESIVKVSIDNNRSKTGNIKISAMPKVGSATVSVYAQDDGDGNLTSATKTITFNTINELNSLVKTLRALPILDDNESIVDTRYSLTNFSANYVISSSPYIDVTGNINSSFYSFTNKSLNLDQDESMFGMVETSGDTSYGMAINIDITQKGQAFNARVLGFSTKEGENNFSTPYLWALATPLEICRAFDKNETIDLINSINEEQIDCADY
jgi:hypothetical protein